MPQRLASEAARAMTRYLTHYPQRGQLVRFVYAEHAFPGSCVSGEYGQKRGSPQTSTSSPRPRRVCSSGMRFAFFFGSDRISRRSYGGIWDCEGRCVRAARCGVLALMHRKTYTLLAIVLACLTIVLVIECQMHDLPSAHAPAASSGHHQSH